MKTRISFSELQVLFSLVYIDDRSNEFAKATQKLSNDCLFIKYILHRLTNRTHSAQSYIHSSQRRKHYLRCLQCLILSNNSVGKTELKIKKKKKKRSKIQINQQQQKSKFRPQGPVVIGRRAVCQTKEEKPAVGA